HVDLLRLHRADPADLALLQHAQQARLGIQRQLADLVQEQGAAVGGLHQAGATGAGAGEAPFSWPNSSDSIRVSGMAAQLTEISGARARRERLCKARATSSLPVPDSPWISTVESVGATLRILPNSSC